ncbi:vacuolar protein sorting 55 [Spinellus fusiger]|nr:vacuolar protein sorting 55 [Spinellus fusiger]
MAGLKSIIALAFSLAIGFLLVILSCALENNWWPLFVVAIFVLAPVPNMLCTNSYNGFNLGFDDEGVDGTDIAHFITGMFVVSGFCLPLVLFHGAVITMSSTIMSICGSMMVYSTIIAYCYFFVTPEFDRH